MMGAMSTLNVQADPVRPYKAYAAVVSAFLVSFIASAATELPTLVVAALTALVAALAVYVTPNPVVTAVPPAGEPLEDPADLA